MASVPLDPNEARDSWVWDGSGINQTVCTQFWICNLLQTDHHYSTLSLNFYKPDALPGANNKHCQNTKGSLKPADWNIYNLGIVCSCTNFTCCIIHVIFFQCFDTVGHQEEHPSCKNWVMRCCCGYVPGSRRRLFVYGPADATASQNSDCLSPHLKPDWFYLSCTGLPSLSWKRGHKRV